jgi:hypothetical protein
LPASPPLPPPLPPPLVGAARPIVVAHGLREQVRFYFGPENMLNDWFLRLRMDARGFVPLTTIATFHRVRALDAPDVAAIAAALAHEASLELSEDSCAVRSRHAWARAVAPPPVVAAAAAALKAPALAPGTRCVGDALHLLGGCPSVAGNRDRLWARVRLRRAREPPARRRCGSISFSRRPERGSSPPPPAAGGQSQQHRGLVGQSRPLAGLGGGGNASASLAGRS